MQIPRATWPDFSLFRPHPAASTLIGWIAGARADTWAWLGDLAPSNALGPRDALLNPPQWEVGHLAWFWEKWLLREGDVARVSSGLVPHTDTLYDSAAIAHEVRWDIPLLSWPAAWQYLDDVLARVCARLCTEPLTDELAYFTQLCVFHHDMHNEAFAIRRQFLGDFQIADGLKAMVQADLQEYALEKRMDIAFPGGVHVQGAAAGSGFVFDNEKWAHEVPHAAFAIASHPVTQGEYARFLDAAGAGGRVDAGGADSARGPAPAHHVAGQAGDVGLQSRHAPAPARQVPATWRKRQGWQRRVFDTWQAITPDAPMVHVNALQAEAYCAWAQRRLPTETEWEIAQAQLRAQGMVWEWTASVFAPYPGFSADPYAEYSAPWFGGQFRVLRGGSIATAPRNIWRTWRNFYLPARSDMFCGFRTCAI